MHVVFLTPVYPAPGDSVSGVFIKNIAEALFRIGVQVTVIHPVPIVPLPAAVLPAKWNIRRERPRREVSESGVVILRPRYPSYPKSTLWGIAHLFIYAAVRRLIAKYDLRPDLVHGHFLYPTGSAAVLLGKRLRIPVCCTMRGDDVNVLPERSSLYRSRVVRVLLSAAAVTSVSKALARKARLLADVPITVIYNGVRLDGAGCVKSLVRQRLAIDQAKFVVLYVGALTRTKGVGELFQVIGSCPDDDVLFVVVGDRINDREEISVPARCRHLGWRPHTEVIELMCAADVLVLPSYGEGMPNVVAEAASIGLPVIATEVGGIPELIDGDSGWLIPPRSAEALGRAIAEVRADYPAAQRRAERARQKVGRDFDLAANAARLREVYLGLLESDVGDKKK